MMADTNSYNSMQSEKKTTKLPPLGKPIIRYQQFQPKGMLEHLSYMLIRPPKLLYDPRCLRLSPYNTTHKYEVHNIPFELSLYLPAVGPVRYIVLYLHCNSSNRLEGSLLVKNLPMGVGLACFDFEGCGIRDGKWVTLGVQEAVEVDIAAKWLKEKGYQVVGWGRSMGAVSLLMSNECDIMLADSPFSNLNTLCKQSGQHIPRLPQCLYLCFFPCVFCCVQQDIVKKTSHNIIQVLDVEKKMARTDKSKSILFMSGTEDSMINKEHSERLHSSFQGHKKLLLFQGGHNSERTKDTLSDVFDFVEEARKKRKALRQNTSEVDKREIDLQPLKFEKTEDNLKRTLV